MYELHPGQLLDSKRAISFNGRLYRNAGTHVFTEHSHRFNAFVAEDGSQNTGRGRSLKYEIHHYPMEPQRNTLVLQEINGPDFSVELTHADMEQYNDLYVIPKREFIPKSQPRFLASLKEPQNEWWSIIERRVKSRKSHMIVIDGHLVWVGDHGRTCEIVDDSVSELGSIMAFSFWSVNATKHNRSTETTAIPGWNMRMWTVGPNVYATTEEKAYELYDFLSANRISESRIDNPRKKRVISSIERDNLAIEADMIVGAKYEEMEERLHQESLKIGRELTRKERYDLAKEILGRQPQRLRSAINDEIKMWLDVHENRS